MFLRCLFGFHDWDYWTDDEEIDHRECLRCQRKEMLVAVPAAPGGYSAWINEDNL